MSKKSFEIPAQIVDQLKEFTNGYTLTYLDDNNNPRLVSNTDTHGAQMESFVAVIHNIEQRQMMHELVGCPDCEGGGQED